MPVPPMCVLHPVRLCTSPGLLLTSRVQCGGLDFFISVTGSSLCLPARWVGLAALRVDMAWAGSGIGNGFCKIGGLGHGAGGLVWRSWICGVRCGVGCKQVDVLHVGHEFHVMGNAVQGLAQGFNRSK